MSIWNVIRDFFVQFVFGGFNSCGVGYSNNMLGYFVSMTNEGLSGDSSISTSDLLIKINNSHDFLNSASINDSVYITLGDWLSTTATIITLVALFIGISCLMVSLFKWIVRLVSLRG